MRDRDVSKFWAIYNNPNFFRELKQYLKKIESYSEYFELSKQYNQQTIALIMNRSPTFISLALQTYRAYLQSIQNLEINKKTLLVNLLIKVPRFKNFYNLTAKSEISIKDLLELEHFWKIPLKGVGPKTFAFLYYCLERHNFKIENCRWQLIS